MDISEFRKMNINEIDKSSFGEFIKVRREQLGFSLRRLAAEIDVSPVFLSDLESAHRAAPKKKGVLEALTKAFHLTEEENAYFYEAARATRIEDLEDYLETTPLACRALRVAQELPEEVVATAWNNFMESLLALDISPSHDK